MKGNYFESAVYHLYHGHETYRDPARFKLFNKLKSYTKKDWLKQIDSYEWGKPVVCSDIDHHDSYYDEDILKRLKESKTPVITMCLVSYRRYDILIKILNRYVEFDIPINMLLWLNSYEDYTDDEIECIKSTCSDLYHCDIHFCQKNVGTGHSRNILLSRAYREYDTPYIMTSDDDIYYDTEEDLLIGASILEQEDYNEYGAVGIWCNPIYNSLYIVEDELRNYKSRKGFYGVDSLGAATMTLKREVLSKCNVDPEYIIGWVDADFSFEIRKQNYKIGLLCDDRWKPTNMSDQSDDIYREARSNKDIKKQSIKRFVKKWGLTPIWRFQKNISEYNGY